MQTFLPYASFAHSARVLDDRRLGRQRAEVLTLLGTLAGVTTGWRRHPAVAMWRGHEDALVLYGLLVTREWRRRGFKDTCYEKIAAFGRSRHPRAPPWLGNPAFHRSHQSALVRKDPARYGPHFPGVPPDLPYVWPGPRR